MPVPRLVFSPGFRIQLDFEVLKCYRKRRCWLSPGDFMW
jgi:hypothetical protein